LTSIKRKKLADAVIEEIQRMIDNGELKEGDKLPNQNEFAAQLGVSRPSLREALHTLTLIGAVEQRPGLGTVLRSRKQAMFAEHLSPPLVSDHETTIELVEARRHIESGIAELAVKNAGDEDIRELKHLVDAMAGALREERNNDYTELDLKFHFKLAESTRNRFMLHMFVTLSI